MGRKKGGSRRTRKSKLRPPLLLRLLLIPLLIILNRVLPIRLPLQILPLFLRAPLLPHRFRLGLFSFQPGERARRGARGVHFGDDVLAVGAGGVVLRKEGVEGEEG